MSESLERAKAAAAKLEAAKRQAAELEALQAQAKREIAEAEAARAAELETAKNERAKQALHRAAEKQRLRTAQRRKAAASSTVAAASPQPTTRDVAPADESNLDKAGDELEVRREVDEPIDDFHEETGDRRKRIGLRCFNCNRMEGHYLLYYRRLWYSYVVGMTLGLAGIVGPYRCQCCGSSRLMVSNFLHPKYYASILSTQSRSDKSRSSSRNKKGRTAR